MKILSISVAGYNVSQYIENTLTSLLDPSILDEIEVLVCDDGGNDDTLEIAKEYESKYSGTVRVIHKENGGYGSVINKNVELATGKYFKQLDGDDWFLTENLVTFVKLLKTTDADYVITPIVEMNNVTKKERLVDRYSEFDEGIYCINNTDLKAFSSMHNSTFKTEILKKMHLSITEHCFYIKCQDLMYKKYYIKMYN